METIPETEVNRMIFEGRRTFAPDDICYLNPVPDWGPIEHAATLDEWKRLLDISETEIRQRLARFGPNQRQSPEENAVMHVYLRWLSEWMQRIHDGETAEYWEEWRQSAEIELRPYRVVEDPPDDEDED